MPGRKGGLRGDWSSLCKELEESREADAETILHRRPHRRGEGRSVDCDLSMAFTTRVAEMTQKRRVRSNVWLLKAHIPRPDGPTVRGGMRCRAVPGKSANGAKVNKRHQITIKL